VFAVRTEISQPVFATHTLGCGLPSFSQVIFQHSWYLLVLQFSGVSRLQLSFLDYFIFLDVFQA
jgi:hypothetical protein